MPNCFSDSDKRVHPEWQDPLGPNDRTGGPEQRRQIFSQLDALRPQLEESAQNFASRSREAADAPAWGEAIDLTRRTMAGDYLNGSPQLDTAVNRMRQNSQAEAANAAAQARSQYARGGMGWSTGNQQASQNAATAAARSANTSEADMRLQNYLTERGYQNAASGQLEGLYSTPLSYLAAENYAQLAPLTEMANIVQTLAGGGQNITPDTIIEQGYADQGFEAIGSL